MWKDFFAFLIMFYVLLIIKCYQVLEKVGLLDTFFLVFEDISI